MSRWMTWWACRWANPYRDKWKSSILFQTHFVVWTFCKPTEQASPARHKTFQAFTANKQVPTTVRLTLTVKLSLEGCERDPSPWGSLGRCRRSNPPSASCLWCSSPDLWWSRHRRTPSPAGRKRRRYWEDWGHLNTHSYTPYTKGFTCSILTIINHHHTFVVYLQQARQLLSTLSSCNEHLLTEDHFQYIHPVLGLWWQTGSKGLMGNEGIWALTNPPSVK